MNKHFVPKYASSVQRCPCEGICSETAWTRGQANDTARASSPANDTADTRGPGCGTA